MDQELRFQAKEYWCASRVIRHTDDKRKRALAIRAIYVLANNGHPIIRPRADKVLKGISHEQRSHNHG